MIHVPIQLCSTTGVCPELITINSTSEILVWEASLDLARISPLTSTDDTTKSSHGQGLWKGIVIKPGGSATITDVEIQNTNVGIKSEGTLIVDNLTVIDSYLGVKNYGTANTSPELASITVPT